jgi:sporulation protein YlmC with PRC-barrel domain
MNAIHDLLDVQLVDQNGQKLGRVDGLLMEVRNGHPPRLTVMEVGSATLLARVSSRLARAWARLVTWFGFDPEPVRLPLKTIRDVGVDVEVEIDPETRAALLDVERWLKRVLRNVPGGP